MSVPRRVWLVGAGPGAADLLTVRAARLLRVADVVVHDQLVTDEVLDLVGPTGRTLAVGRRCGRVVVEHGDVVELLDAEARPGRVVVRLKGGDPVVLGRGGEEALDLAARGIECEFVPGITSAVAAPELAGIPVTHRGLSAGVLVLAAQRAGGDAPTPAQLATAAGFDGTVVLLMGASRLAAWCEALVAHGRPATTPAALIGRAGRRDQLVVTATLDDLAARVAALGAAPTPATVVVGDVVGVPDAVARALEGAGRYRASA